MDDGDFEADEADNKEDAEDVEEEEEEEEEEDKEEEGEGESACNPRVPPPRVSTWWNQNLGMKRASPAHRSHTSTLPRASSLLPSPPLSLLIR